MVMQEWCGNYTEYLWRQIKERNQLGNIAFETSTEKVTYKQFFTQINRAGNFLLDQGCVPGDRVLLIMNDSPCLMYHFMGAIRSGVIPVILNTLQSPHEYLHYVEDSGAKLCIVEQNLQHKTVEIAGTCSLFISSQNNEHLSNYSPELEYHACKSRDPAFWQYTSGSTGKPKAVIHTQIGPIKIFNEYAVTILKITSQDRLFSVSRAFFGYGLGNSLIFPTLAGATSILFEGPINIENVVKIIKEFKPTIFFSVPSFYAQLLASDESIRTFCRAGSQIRAAISAGEVLPSSTYYQWKERTNISLLDGIGSTEALHIFVSNRPDCIQPGSCGKPLSGIQVKFVEEENLIPGCRCGRLLIRYPGMANGYWQRPKLTAAVFVDGWLDTGDIYKIDKKGFYWHVGRSDDLFKVKGMWVSPVEVEEALIKDDRVLDSGVVGEVNEQGFTEVTAFIVLNDPKDEEHFSDTVHRHLEELVANYKIPRRFYYVSEIPRTTTGKKKRYELSRLSKARFDRPSSDSTLETVRPIDYRQKTADM